MSISIMKKLIVVFFACVLVSCAASKWSIMSLEDKELVEKVLSTNSKLYERYNKGEIALDKIKYRKQEDGSTKYQFTYHIIHDDDDSMVEWICIYMPMLND